MIYVNPHYQSTTSQYGKVEHETCNYYTLNGIASQLTSVARFAGKLKSKIKRAVIIDANKKLPRAAVAPQVAIINQNKLVPWTKIKR